MLCVYLVCGNTWYLPWFMFMKSINFKPLYGIVCLLHERSVNLFRVCNLCWSICVTVIASAIYVGPLLLNEEKKSKKL